MAERPEDVAAIVDRLNERLASRRPDIERRLAYLRGNEGRLVFASQEFRQAFEARFTGFCDNWCLPVAQAPMERINHLGIRLPGEIRPDAELRRAFVESGGERGLSESMLVMGAAARAFALVHPNGRLTFEHPSQAIVDHDPVTGERRYGLITWVDDDYDYATLYSPSTVWRLRRRRSRTGERRPRRTDPLLGWQESDHGEPVSPNPLRLVPLVEFRNLTLLDDEPLSDIAGVSAMQDAINLVWAYLLNALDYASLPQRVVTGALPPVVPILDENGQQVGERPVELDQLIRDRIMFLSDENAKIAEWTAAQLDAFSAVIEHAVEHVAAQTRTPPHYLVAKLVNTAAESLTISEAGLVSKTRERIRVIEPALREVYRLIALAMGDEAKAEAVLAAKLLWADVQYRSDAQRTDALQKRAAMGYPLEYLLELDGVDPDEIPRILEMARSQAEMDPTVGIARALASTGTPAGVIDDGDGA